MFLQLRPLLDSAPPDSPFPLLQSLPFSPSRPCQMQSSLFLTLLVLLVAVVLFSQAQSLEEYGQYEPEPPVRGVNLMQQGYGMGYRQNRLNTRSLHDRIRSLKENVQKNDYRGAIFG
ncbi:hypothetical protein PRIPAC_76084 [Pristionchus pacificus]|uniref:Uncharacterized protein n=1 Tax=Pristionchus pacificus TaxID=54126 RepID=A0A2A6C0W4_PRIPA|nr:hypothetical protein PRIPAC_76084 [Pristionchus pacificus]|eukprot:PDM71758.1 hypothetical protein PRIPAC_38165 [Pristionchus pacificus]